jgi:hypothetical protein
MLGRYTRQYNLRLLMRYYPLALIFLGILLLVIGIACQPQPTAPSIYTRTGRHPAPQPRLDGGGDRIPEESLAGQSAAAAARSI